MSGVWVGRVLPALVGSVIGAVIANGFLYGASWRWIALVIGLLFFALTYPTDRRFRRQRMRQARREVRRQVQA